MGPAENREAGQALCETGECVDPVPDFVSVATAQLLSPFRCLVSLNRVNPARFCMFPSFFLLLPFLTSLFFGQFNPHFLDL